MEKPIVYTLDRLEGNVAVLVDEEGYSHPVPLAQLPTEVKVSDVVHCVNGQYCLAPQATEERRSYVLSLQDKLRRKNK